MLRKAWIEFEYRLDVCEATRDACLECVDLIERRFVQKLGNLLDIS